ncbi:hypothetical protein [Methylomonas sp. HYX-M1]|uniref:hypothetical protein n=1 Tax=Methylomonas sp. HYX-M1 TaxID=3139307 RepID=UPI00345BBA0D
MGNTQSAAVLRDHIGLIKTRLEQLEQRNKQLEEENADFVKRMHEMQQQIARDAKTSQYTEYRGALFERGASGTYSKTPRCPACHSVMFSFQNVMEFTCGKPTCGQIANFTGFDLESVLKELESL